MEIIAHVNPIPVLSRQMKEGAGNPLRDKLHRIYHEIFDGDELDFLVHAMREIPVLLEERRDLSFMGVIKLWANRQLALLE